MTTLEPRTSFQPLLALPRRGLEIETTPAASTSLTEAVRAAVTAVPVDDLRPVAAPAAGPFHQPHALLALLVYCYARGLLASSDIEQALWRDEQVREGCGRELPHARMLRRFRRQNPRVLRQCLVSALRHVMERNPATIANGGFSESALMAEADRQIEKAIFVDGMSMDGRD